MQGQCWFEFDINHLSNSEKEVNMSYKLIDRLEGKMRHWKWTELALKKLRVEDVHGGMTMQLALAIKQGFARTESTV